MKRVALITDWGFPRRMHAARGGFSLVELLVVLSIVALLTAASVPALNSVMESDSLSRGGQQVADAINLARQLASSHNATMELRLIKLNSTIGYSALQIWTTNSSGTMQPISRIAILPQSIIVTDNMTLSPALAGSGLTSGTIPAGNGAASGSAYVGFEITASGLMLPLTGMNSNYFTVVPARYEPSSSLSGIKNFVMVQVNPVTATPLVYRP